MKRSLTLLFFSTLTMAAIARADRLPPGDMIGDGEEVPVAIVPAAGGVSASDLVNGVPSVTASLTAGETAAGDMQMGTCLGAGQPCTAELGYGVFEFYSDRIPVYQLSVALDDGRVATNNPQIQLHVTFRDDLSGLKLATITDPTSHLTTPLDLSGLNDFSFTLGSQEGDYTFDFNFEDRAGNVTNPQIARSIRLDTTPPVTSSVTINQGALFTNSSTVTLTVSCLDQPSFPSGTDKVRVGTNANLAAASKTFPFVEPTTGFQFYFGDESTGTKSVYVQCGDVAGNWSVGIASASINRGKYSPDGTLTFDRSTGHVTTGLDGIPETDQLDVPVILNWDPAQAGSLTTIILSAAGVQDTPISILLTTRPPFTVTIPVASTSDVDGIKTVQAVFIDAEQNRSDPVSAQIWLNLHAPAAPRVSETIGISSITIQASMFAPTPGVTTYIFTPTLGLGAPSGVVGVTNPGDTAVFVATGLVPNTAYAYDVRSEDLFRMSSPAVFDRNPLITLAAAPVSAADPQNPDLQPKEIFLIRVSWAADGNPADTNYFLQYSTASDFSNPINHSSGWVNTLVRDADGLATATTYYFRVKARNRETVAPVETAWYVIGSTPTESFKTPLPPLSFDAIEINPTDILWKWVRNPSTEEGFLIEFSTGGPPIATIPLRTSTDTFTYRVTNLTPNTVESISILSYNHLNNQFFPSASLTKSVITPPAAPSTGTLSVDGSNITATWNPNGNPGDTEFLAQIAANDGFTDQLADTGWQVATSYLFRGLRPSTTYYVRAQARSRLHPDGTRDTSAWTLLGSIATQTFDHSSELDLSNFSAWWQLKLPPNVIQQDYALNLETDPNNFSAAMQVHVEHATEKAMAETNGFRFPIPGGLIQITAMDVSGQVIDPPLQNQAELIHLFGDLAGTSGQAATLRSGAVHAAGGGGSDRPFNPVFNSPLDGSKDIRLSTLRLWMLDTETESWIRLPANAVDFTDDQVQGHLTSFGVFAVMGSPSLDVNDVIVYPVPWRPNGPNAGLNPGQTGTEQDGIHFTNVPQEGKISIYDLRGARVREFPLTGDPIILWAPVVNEEGTPVQSGTYFWVAESAGQKKTGKLMVIR